MKEVLVKRKQSCCEKTYGCVNCCCPYYEFDVNNYTQDDVYVIASYKKIEHVFSKAYISARVMEVRCSLPTTSSLGCSVGRGRFPEPRLPRGGDGNCWTALLSRPDMSALPTRVPRVGSGTHGR